MFKEKNLLSKKAFFSFRAGPILKGEQSILIELASLKVYQFPLSRNMTANADNLRLLTYILRVDSSISTFWTGPFPV